MVPWPKDQGSFVAAFGQPNGSYNGRSWNTAGVSRAGSSHNARYVNPFVRGLPTAAVVAIFVNRGWATADYENRRKTSSGGQRF